MISAIKKSNRDQDLVIRLFNPTGVRLKGQVGLYRGIKKAWLTDFNEEKKERIPINSDETITIDVRPKKIVTIRITPRH
jgi:alpha-mannosidase